MPALELPRLTGTLRAFSGLSPPGIENGNSVEVAKVLERKRKQRAERQFGKALPWNQLKEFLLDACNDKTSKKEVCYF